MKRPSLISAVLVVAALLAAAYTLTHASRVECFRIPVAFSMREDVFYVLEKDDNIILAFTPGEAGAVLKLNDRVAIEEDDPRYFYMVRHLYQGSSGIVVHSFIYEQKTKRFLGYRFREYSDFRSAPREILTVFLARPEDVPEFSYARGPEGGHYFVHNLPGRPCLWKVPPEGGAVVHGKELPPTVTELGRTNQTSSYWMSLAVRDDGQLFASSGETGQVIEFSPDGGVVRAIGTVGFGPEDLLSPNAVFFLKDSSGDQLLTVSSSGNRTWVEFDRAGKAVRAIEPLRAGYPFLDILPGRIFRNDNGRFLSFDLVNKCLIYFGNPFRASREYRYLDRTRIALGIGAALLLILAAVFLPRVLPRLRRLRRLRIPLFIKLLLLFAPLVVGGLVASDWVRDIMEEELKAESVRRLANLARAVVNTVPLSDLQAIRKPEDRESPVYEKIYTTVNNLIDRAHVDYTPRWIIHKIRDGRLYFGISGWRGPIYEPFIVPEDRTLFIQALRDNTPQHGSFIDDQGEWFSYLCPIADESGKVVYILELYRPTEEMNRVNRDVRERMVKAVGGTVLGVLLLAGLFSWLITRPIKKLISGTEVIRKGNFDHRMGITSRDEVGDLARAFDRMAADLKTYTEEIARSTAEKERIGSELRLAREMQQGILPHLFPPAVPPATVEIVGRMEPAREIGGDFYDFFLIDPEHLGVVIADVSGKGLPAGLFMMVTRALIRNNALANTDPAETLTRVNRLLSVDNPSATFVTVFYFVCDLVSGEIAYCNAGHNPPLLLRGGKAQWLKTGGSAQIAVGVSETAKYRAERLRLNPGETLLLYTDGVTDAINPSREMFGEKRFLALAEGSAPGEPALLQKRIFSALTAFRGNVEQFDDITVLLFRLLRDRCDASASHLSRSNL
ncbi:MAG: SpoIIE family protein phosphatase [Candidatus Aureabacteria bacterium]|nr:SpoIIE family protein phosphatase [Candidatus Auribacterota bacterium]